MELSLWDSLSGRIVYVASRRASVPRHKFCTKGLKTHKCVWGQSFGFAAGLLPGVGMVQDF